MSEPASTNSLAEGRRQGSGANKAGWLCFALGMILMFMSLGLFVLYGPLFLAAFILSIVAIAHRQVMSGVVLLVASLAVPTTSWIGLVALKIGSSVAETKQAKNASLSAIAFEDVKGYIDGGYMYCKGKVRNNGSTAVSFVKVQVEWLDRAGNVLDTDYTYAVSSDSLRPGGAKTFEIMSRADPRMKRFRYKVQED
ncbi:MAG: FxLYD domain-containing protein [Acidobacteriia bacterium]|nr:FxLYD domain-containing protein [Terriglobia bacterium]